MGHSEDVGHRCEQGRRRGRQWSRRAGCRHGIGDKPGVHGVQPGKLKYRSRVGKCPVWFRQRVASSRHAGEWRDAVTVRGRSATRTVVTRSPYASTMRRDARLLKGKALASLRRCARAFNDFDDDGRVTAVLLHLQHAFEMLLKAGLVEKKVRVLDKTKGRSIGFDRCVRLGAEHLRLSGSQCGLLRTVDALRDDEQHYFGNLSEGLLYTHVRASFTLFGDLLDDIFAEKLADHLPTRVLPISTDPPADVEVLIDGQYRQAKKLLQPGKRRRADARAFIRGLLAMEAHVAEDVLVTEKDVNRVERAIKSGKELSEVFPRLESVGTVVEGAGVELTVRFSKRRGDSGALRARRRPERGGGRSGD